MNHVFEERLTQFDSAEVNHLYEEEVRILDLIRNGETGTLEKLLSRETLAFPFLTQDEMKNHEYMLVSATAVICRASIAAGTPVSVCILTSDRFLRKISALRTETEARALLREIVLTYAKRNRETRNAGAQTPLSAGRNGISATVCSSRCPYLPSPEVSAYPARIFPAVFSRSCTKRSTILSVCLKPGCHIFRKLG